MQKFARAAIIVKPDDNVAEYVQAVAAAVRSCGCGLVVEREAAGLWEDGCPWQILERLEIHEHADVVISVGGDGTVLGAARDFAPHGIPIIGVNAGRLGFITDIVIERVAEDLPRMLCGEFIEDCRTMLEGSILRDGREVFSSIALNDIGITHGRALGMVEYALSVDGARMGVQHADGIIVSTATGSTAYALAAGGPVMHPAVHSMLLVPIAPHMLTNRPIVISSASTVEVAVIETKSAVANFDAQVVFDVVPGDVLRVAASRITCTMLRPAGYSYFDILRRKLKWNTLPESERTLRRGGHRKC